MIVRRRPRARRVVGALAILLAAGVALTTALVRAADHADAPLITLDKAADVADVYAFASRSDPSKLILAMTLSDALPPGEIMRNVSQFDPAVLYQFKFDVDGDKFADKVIQAFVTGTPRNQTLHVRGPAPSPSTGQTNVLLPGPDAQTVKVSTGKRAHVATGVINAFAGVRDDPFFFDLVAFQDILAGRASGFKDPGTDSFAGLNTYAIVLELPTDMITTDPAVTRVWATTSR